jgi:signal transduction histidine kinase
VFRRLGIPYIDATTTPISFADAELSIVRRFDETRALQLRIDRWTLVAFLLATVLAVLGALWLAARLSRPMEDLAAATATVDLDRLDVRFAAGRDDEIGVLSRRLTAMVDRLRASAARLREAERRATVGEIARQVNHDIKNGLAPIRNVVRHLAQVAQDQPTELPTIFTARQRTLESSIGYLETLAQNYARLSPSLAARPTDVGTIIAEVIGAAQRPGAEVRAMTARGLPPVLADAVVVRRILENLVVNAVDSLEGKPGEVIVGAEPLTLGEAGAPRPSGRLVRLSVRDSGRGMTEAELARAFDDFYTTKPQGTGLGLSVVRRLVADLGGSLRIETAPGVGTEVQVDLPAAPATDPTARTTPTGAR